MGKGDDPVAQTVTDVLTVPARTLSKHVLQ
jgi:hypothetical protein